MSINAGLDQAGAGIIVFSSHSRDSRWVEAEVSYLTYAGIQESKLLIPVMAGDDAWVPPLLRPLARRCIEEMDAICDALLHRKAGRPPRRPPEQGRLERVLITLRREPLQVEVSIGGRKIVAETFPPLPRGLLEAQAVFLRGFRSGLRSPAAAECSALESSLTELGRELRALCLPGDAGHALANLLDGCPVGTTVEVLVDAEGVELLGLPFEALRLPDDRLLSTHAAVVMLRRPWALTAGDAPALAGPVKILVAVGAPDEEHTSAAVLDQERELQNILDAVAPAQRHENIEVRILEVGHPEVVGAAIESDAYHVLHISCHGLPGALELEDEEGRAVRTTAQQLLDPIRRTGRPLPMVLLNSCHGGVQAEQTASFAEALLRGGVPCVLAMQTSVSDHYATQLARSFYEHLAKREFLLARGSVRRPGAGGAGAPGVPEVAGDRGAAGAGRAGSRRLPARLGGVARQAGNNGRSGSRATASTGIVNPRIFAEDGTAGTDRWADDCAAQRNAAGAQCPEASKTECPQERLMAAELLSHDKNFQNGFAASAFNFP